MGDLKFGRTVHSLSRLLSMYQDIKVTLIAPVELAMPVHIIDELTNAGHQVTITNQLAENSDNTDILYLTRIQEERFPSQEEANKYRGQFRLNKDIYTQYCQPDTVIMHPLPRDSRLAI